MKLAPGLLELFYHAVGILSCRHKPPSDRPGASHPSYIRQNLAAIRIYSIAAIECSQVLPPLPIVPYALALSMGVSYQQLRASKLITHFDRAKASLEACCSQLEDIGNRWYSAEAMARLGRKALHQSQEVRPEHPQRSRDLKSQEACQTAPAAPKGPERSASCVSLSPHDGACRAVDTPPIASIPAVGPGDPLGPTGGVQSMDSGGFADIDMLFGDFLDLSLPTNFWDPVFLSDTQT